jgi:hypothetical protein
LSARFQTIVDVEATAEEADELADVVLAWLVETGFIPSLHGVTRNEVSTEGLVVLTRRHVFYSMTGEDEITCPHCRYAEVPDDDMFEIIGRWFDGGSGDRSCPNCGRRVGLNDWTWAPPWGFGYLGFQFWDLFDWLSPQFKVGIERLLGHRLVYPHGKL